MVDDPGLLPMARPAAREVPGAKVLDAHTHLGQHDPDGYRCSPEELIGGLELIDARALVFPMHEPDGYPPANDMVFAEAEAADGRLFAFCRLDPAESPLRGAPLASMPGRAASSFTRAPRASTSTTPTWRTCSRSPTSGGCRSSATPAAAFRRSAGTRWRCARATRA